MGLMEKLMRVDEQRAPHARGQIKPIETKYNGYRFRSRLEARWAVFFDALGIEYEYEPEGFELPSGKRYLPDFRVKCCGTRGVCDPDSPFDLYIEVKGRMTQGDADKILEFTNLPDDDYDFDYGRTSNPTLIVGNIPRIVNDSDCIDSHVLGSYEPMDGIDIHPFNYETIDGDNFAAYPAASGGKFYLMGDDSNYINRGDVWLVAHAYCKAREARFEHGETPKARTVLVPYQPNVPTVPPPVPPPAPAKPAPWEYPPAPAPQPPYIK